MIKLTEQQALLSLLEENYSSVESREECTFDRLAGPFGRRLVLFGVGGLGQRTLDGLRSLGIEPLALTDNNPKSWHTILDGLPVLPPQEAVERYGDSAIFVLTIWNHVLGHPLVEITTQLKGFGTARVISFAYLYWQYPKQFLPFFSLDLPRRVLEQTDQVSDCFQLWSDEASRREYLAQIRWRLHLDFEALQSPVAGRQYFPQDLFSLVPEEVFVDCGAFDGDTVRDFLIESSLSFKKLIAFEPDQQNFTKLASYVASLGHDVSRRVDVKPFAVGDCNAVLQFSADGNLQSTVSETGTVSVDCVRLDDVLDDHPTYIKMDVEGAEPDVIMGAEKLIRCGSPILAVSVYHECDHLWKLPLLIRSMSDSYTFFLRPHRRDAWDLVCYAIPRCRLLNPSEVFE